MTQHRDVEVEHNGRLWRGSFEVSGQTLRVSSAYGSKATQIGQMRAETLAMHLLGEIVRAFASESGG